MFVEIPDQVKSIGFIYAVICRARHIPGRCQYHYWEGSTIAYWMLMRESSRYVDVIAYSFIQFGYISHHLKFSCLGNVKWDWDFWVLKSGWYECGEGIKVCILILIKKYKKGRIYEGINYQEQPFSAQESGASYTFIF